MTDRIVDVAAGSAFDVVARPLEKADVKGVKTNWEVTRVPGNVDPKYLPAKPTLKAKAIKGTATEWTNTLTLPHVGGETYAVTATLDGKGGAQVEKANLKARRSIPLTVYHTSAAAKRAWEAAKGAFKAAFAPVAIEFVEAAPVQTDVATVEIARGVDTARSIRDGAAKLFTGGRLPAVRPAKGHLRLFAVDQLTILKDAEFFYPLTADAASDNPEMIFPLPGGVLPARPVHSCELVYGRRVVAAVQGAVDRGQQPAGSSWKSGATRTRNLTASATRHADHKVKVVVPDEALPDFADPSDEPSAVLHIVYEHSETGFLGWSNGKDIIFVATQQPDGTPFDPRVVARIAAHEVGHAFGQVAPKRRLYPRGGEPNDRHYEGMGGEGHHCATATQVTGGVRVWAGGARNLCVMYHDATAEHVDPAFCEHCALNLKLADLRLSGVRATWGT